MYHLFFIGIFILGTSGFEVDFPEVQPTTNSQGDGATLNSNEMLKNIKNSPKIVGNAVFTLLGGSTCYMNGYMKLKTIAAAMYTYDKADKKEEAYNEIVKTTIYLLSIDVYGAIGPTGDALKMLNVAKNVVLEEVTDAIKTNAPNVVEKVHHAVDASIGKMVAKTKALVQGSEAAQTAGTFISKVYNLGKKAIQGLKWINKMFRLAVVSDVINIIVCLDDYFSAWEAGNDYKMNTALIGIIASSTNIAVSIGALTGPVGWIVAGLLSFVNMLLSWLDPGFKAVHKPPAKISCVAGDTRVQQGLKSLGVQYRYLRNVSSKHNPYDYVIMNNWAVSSLTFPLNGKQLSFVLTDLQEGSNTLEGNIGKYYCEIDKYYSNDKVFYTNTKTYWNGEGHPQKDFSAGYPQHFYGARGTNTFTGNLYIQLRTFEQPQFVGALIDTNLPQPKDGLDKSDDTIFIDDISHFALLPENNERAKIELRLGDGEDVVTIAGRVGYRDVIELSTPHVITANIPLINIHFQNKVSSDPDDTLSFGEMINNQNLLQGRLLTVTKHLEIFKKEGSHIKICYHLTATQKIKVKKTIPKRPDTVKKDFVFCAITIDTHPSLLVSSPIDDVIHLYHDNPIMIRNEEGSNTYNVILQDELFESLDNSERKFKYSVHDNSTSPLKFTITSTKTEGTDFYVINRERQLAIEIYAIVNDVTSLVRQIEFGTNVPTSIHIGTGETLRSNMRTSLPSFTNQPVCSDSTDGYRFNGNIRRNCDAKVETFNFICFCTPAASTVEEYNTVDMGNGFNMVIIHNDLLSSSNGISHTIQIVRESITEDSEEEKTLKDKKFQFSNYQWVLQYRSRGQEEPLRFSRRPHFDVILNYVSLIRFDGNNRRVFDLTDNDGNFGGVINPKEWEDRTGYYSLGSGENLEGTKNDDFFYIKMQEEPTVTTHIVIDLKEGYDTVIFSWDDVTHLQSRGQQYKIVEHQGKKTIAIGKGAERQDAHALITINNAERVACQYKGILRTLPKWKEGTTMEGFEQMVFSACGEEIQQIPQFRTPNPSETLFDTPSNHDYLYTEKCKETCQ